MKRKLFCLPIVILLLMQSFAAFSAETSDGEAIAAALNARYEKVVTDCDGKPAFYCSGIIIRTNETSFTHPTWQPWWPDFTKDSLQFSYLRKDLGVRANTPFGYSEEGFGIITNPGNDQLATRCIFPSDANSTSRNQNGCGDLITMNEKGDVDNSTCKSYGIETAEQWWQIMHFCSFSTHDSKQFSESLKVTQKSSTYNEMIINTSDDYWSGEDPSKDNIQALWYNPDASGSKLPAGKTGLEAAQAEQQLYFDKTGEWIPVVSYNISNDKQFFSYSESDQKVSPTKK